MRKTENGGNNWCNWIFNCLLYSYWYVFDLILSVSRSQSRLNQLFTTAVIMIKIKKKKKIKNDPQSNTQKNNYWATTTPQSNRDNPRCPERVGISSSTSDTCPDTLDTNLIICHKRTKYDGIVTTTNGKYQCSYVTQIYHNG